MNYYVKHAPQYARYLTAKDAGEKAQEALVAALAACYAAGTERKRAFTAWQAAGEPRDLDPEGKLT